VIYVDADAPGTNDGSSWDNAFHDLQSALDVAGASSVIKVADGTYQPSVLFIHGFQPTATFSLPDGLNLEGSFAGSGSPDPDARELSPPTSVLSGDLGVLGDEADNCWTVVTVVDGRVTLDGFTVRDGNNYAGLMEGAGLQIKNAAVTVENCFFTENVVLFEGSAIDMQNGVLTVRDSKFEGNHGHYGNPGGSAIEAEGSVVVADSSFTSNGGFCAGGGAISAGPSLEVEQCEFTYDTAMFGGGAISGGNIKLRRCSFNGCGASGAYSVGGHGGAVYAGGSLVAVDCDFTGNHVTGSDWGGNAPGQGGAVWCGGDVELRACQFINNAADGSIYTGGFGGAVFVAGGATTLVDCQLIENTARSTYFSFGSEPPARGGAIYALEGTVTLDGCEVLNNESESKLDFPNDVLGQGGGIYGDCVLQDCILWGNVADPKAVEASQLTGGTTVVNFSVIQGWTGTLGGRGNSGTLPVGALPDDIGGR